MRVCLVSRRLLEKENRLTINKDFIVEYRTSHFILGETEPEDEPQKALSDIVHLVKARLAMAMNDSESGLSETHPRTLISMVVTNILVNLVFSSIAISDVGRRIDMFQDILDEITSMSLHLWKALEANRADKTNAH